jgi:hypothetical protein
MKSKFYLVGLILALIAFALPKQEAKAQVKELLNSSYNVASDTVVNTATAVLRLQIKSGVAPVTVIARVLEIVGTTGGTLTLVGSMDGTNWRALTTKETATALATYTPADVSTAQLFMWRITESPTPWIGVQYTGTGSMTASVSAKAYVIK